MEPQDVKDLVRRKYAEIALQDKETNAASCCGAGGCSTEVYNIMADDYTKLEGYHPDADLGLGCGLPTAFARIKAGDVVVDLGSGAGNDAFIARHETGDSGRVIGIDFTPAMIEKARRNAAARGFANVEFLQGDIEQMPLPDATADVVVSNCVLNLVPNKAGVFREIFRVLKPGGHFSISDIVLLGTLPPAIREAAELYAGCVSGAIQKEEYLNGISAAGFTGLQLQKEKTIHVPDDILRRYLSDEAIAAFRASGTGILSITVYAERPQAAACCAPGCCGN
ncbi:arsenite methyltransferase [Flaviaesturariibacter aridisoli]|uniref:Arsenite methyltransferase n=1 Tax=Flaviaesturariibacter aridisoli TaxID=2545761 RepID=A0A4R4E591_9BACT|nr:arsenite methyltransferase [Flaviaesturariibacter aridisoli]TCZ72795.1 arsenite methyltransferase [Flaviaesturariibacter aridisoli]